MVVCGYVLAFLLTLNIYTSLNTCWIYQTYLRFFLGFPPDWGPAGARKFPPAPPPPPPPPLLPMAFLFILTKHQSGGFTCHSSTISLCWVAHRVWNIRDKVTLCITWHALLHLILDLLFLNLDTGDGQVVTNSQGVPPKYGTPVHLAPSSGWSHTSRPLPAFGAPGDVLFFKKIVWTPESS